MARFTSIGMPKKTFVASAAEESGSKARTEQAGPSQPASTDGPPPKKKSKRRGTRGKVPPPEGAIPEVPVQKRGWGRDPSIARRTKQTMQHTEDRRQKREHERNTGTTCFACRSVGHAARDCPNVLLAAAGGAEGSANLLGEADGKEAPKRGMKRKAGKKGGDVVGNKCYRCNGNDHSLGNCPDPLDPTNPTPFATCYICLASGHLSSLCPSNPGRGIYVNGGSCKVCESTAHRAKDCPEEAKMKRAEAERRREIVLGSGAGELGADEDDFMAESRVNMRNQEEGKGKRKKHVPANNSQRGPKAAYPTNSGAVEEPQAEHGEEEVKKVVPMPKGKKKVIAF